MQQVIRRVRIPRKGEILGLVTAMLGANRLRVDCEDGKERIGRIRGKIVKRVWIRVNDVVLLLPWKIQSDERADIIWRYTRTEFNWLKRKGYGKNIDIS